MTAVIQPPRPPGTRTAEPVMIAGAGPSGLAAAIAVARHGGTAHVLERRLQVGARFHGDFQGLENWTTGPDVLEELDAFGIQPAFEHVPFRECTFFGPDGAEHTVRSEQPLWYLVRRGTAPGTLDTALRRQAVDAGVTIEHGRAVEHLPTGGLVAHGPYRVDAIAAGYVFETDMRDAAFGVLSDQLAPAGYGYLLVCKGRATLATCMFAAFHEERACLARTLEFFQQRVGIRLRNEIRFGGFGNMSAQPMLRRGHLLLAGEAAGLQDALFGFGMRYAMASGHMAGAALARHDAGRYALEATRRLVPLAQASIVNRFLYARLGQRGQRWFLGRLGRAPDPRAWLRQRYAHQWWTTLLYPLARTRVERRQRRLLHHECRVDCDCTFCRCTREIAGVRP